MSDSLQKFLDWAKENHERQPTLGSELAAMGREALKDVRQTINEIVFGQGEHAPEMGTPLNPVQREIFDARHQEQDKDFEMGI
jgi:hypothetical protein